MRYLCLIHHSAEAFERMSPSEHEAMQTDSADYDEQLAAQGYLVLAQALRESDTAKTLRVRRRKATVTDGPFAETKEQLVGFILIEAEDMDAAVDIASHIPLARTGTVEVREAYRFHRGLIKSSHR